MEIYTDGGHKGRWGSWAYVIVHHGAIISEASGREKNTSSNHMEFRAAIEALEALPEGSVVTLYSDSRILVDTFCLKIPLWKANIEQTQKLETLSKKHTITWQWIKAHSGKVFNERCDELCTLEMTRRTREEECLKNPILNPMKSKICG